MIFIDYSYFKRVASCAADVGVTFETFDDCCVRRTNECLAAIFNAISWQMTDDGDLRLRRDGREFFSSTDET